MLHHDLGKFVIDRSTLSWTLGLGFAMSYAVRARDLDDADQQQWLRWLDRIQKSICARYVGQPVQSFEHTQPAEVSADDGLIRATYGPVQLTANLGPAPVRDGPCELAGFGFVAQAPGMIAGNLRRISELDYGEEGLSFVSEATPAGLDVWLYAPGGTDVAVLVPPTDVGPFTATIEDHPPWEVQAVDNTVRMRLPAAPRRLWHVRLVRR